MKKSLAKIVEENTPPNPLRDNAALVILQATLAKHLGELPFPTGEAAKKLTRDCYALADEFVAASLVAREGDYILGSPRVTE